MSAALAAQRASDLVRLAADAGAADGEARNAALAAAKLIAKHGLKIVDAETLMRSSTPASSGPKNPPGHPWRSSRRQGDPDAARRIDNRFPSRCRVCGDPVEIGERVWWRPGLGVSHLDCGDEW